ncbi:MAG: (Fe-S)-binding protein [Actinobacteria bacterium]|nr:(Fe-S)-binding protein [Actinomycetota bacterium]
MPADSTTTDSAGGHDLSSSSSSTLTEAHPPLALRPDVGFIDRLAELAGDSFLSCYQCGTCSVVCPFSPQGTHLPRQEMLFAQWGLENELLSSPNLWICTTCGNCARLCPREVDIPGTISAARDLYVASRDIPRELATAFENTSRQGNPLGHSARKRADWAGNAGVDVPVMAKLGRSVDILFFTECYWSYHPRGMQAAQAMARMMSALGVDWAILGVEERCVADSQRLAGEIGLFEEAAQKNIEVLGKYSFKRLVTPDPHAYNALRNLYPSYGGSYQVQHYTQFLAELIPSMSLGPIPQRTVTFHDPCYLGRHNGEFEAPRRLLEAIPGISLVEMGHCRADGYCCGGGGGGMWNSSFVAEQVDERLAEVRIKEAVGTGADVLAVCCPFEVSLFEDAAKSTGNDDKIVVRDIIELLDESLKLH